MSERRLIGTCEDLYAMEVRLYVRGPMVIVEHDSPDLILPPADREEFQRLFMEAERQAEAHAAAAS